MLRLQNSIYCVRENTHGTYFFNPILLRVYRHQQQSEDSNANADPPLSSVSNGKQTIIIGPHEAQRTSKH